MVSSPGHRPPRQQPCRRPVRLRFHEAAESRRTQGPLHEVRVLP